MKYKFVRLENGAMKKCEFDSYNEVKAWVNEEITKFKKVNSVRDETKDRAFIAFKSELENVLGGLMSDYMKCETCKDVDHEGQFCRCEERNCRIAKEMRERNEGPWKLKVNP